MSIWTDLLFLHGHAATVSAIAELVPQAFAPTRRAPEPAPAPIAAPVVRPQPRTRPIPLPNKISPNDLW